MKCHPNKNNPNKHNRKKKKKKKSSDMKSVPDSKINAAHFIMNHSVHVVRCNDVACYVTLYHVVNSSLISRKSQPTSSCLLHYEYTLMFLISLLTYRESRV